MRYKSNAGGFHATRISIKPLFFRILPFLLIIAIVILWIRLDHAIRPYAEKICLYECRSMTAQVVSESVADALSTLSGMELSPAAVSYDDNGNITAIHTSPDAVNIVQTVLLEELNTALQEQKHAEFSVHFGTLTGMHTLTGKGAEIPLRYLPVGGAQVQLQSEFSSAGINQTIHTLTAEITIHAGCSVPLYQADTTEAFTYLLAETVIVGDVPSVSWRAGT